MPSDRPGFGCREWKLLHINNARASARRIEQAIEQKEQLWEGPWWDFMERIVQDDEVKRTLGVTLQPSAMQRGAGEC